MLRGWIIAFAIFLLPVSARCSISGSKNDASSGIQKSVGELEEPPNPPYPGDFKIHF